MAARGPCSGRTCTVHVDADDPDLFWCPTHGAHRCGRGRCTARCVGTDAQVACRITGRVFHAMIARHPHRAVEHTVDLGGDDDAWTASSRRRRTRRTRATTATGKRSPFDRAKRDGQKAIARAMIYELLFGSRRATMVAKHHHQTSDRVRLAVARFARVHARKPSPTEAETIVRSALVGGPRVRRVPMDRSLWARGVDAVLRVWDAMARTPYARAEWAHIHFPVCALGCVYLLRQGLAFGGHQFVPRDRALARFLPAPADVHRLGFRVKDVTTGKNHITKAFRSSMATRSTRLAPPHAPSTPKSPTRPSTRAWPSSSSSSSSTSSSPSS